MSSFLRVIIADMFSGLQLFSVYGTDRTRMVSLDIPHSSSNANAQFGGGNTYPSTTFLFLMVYGPFLILSVV